MKVAIPTRNNVVDDHFGHCEYYTIFTISEDKLIVCTEIQASPEGCGWSGSADRFRQGSPCCDGVPVAIRNGRAWCRKVFLFPVLSSFEGQSNRT